MSEGARMKPARLAVVASRHTAAPSAPMSDVSSLIEEALPPEPTAVARLRDDLHVREDGPDRVVVRAPESSVEFPIYRIEWTAARLMNGLRGVDEIAAEMGCRGTAATPQLVRSLMRELKGYGFLAEVGEAALAPAPESAPTETVSDEEKHLLSAATSLQARGELQKALDYLLALLEINPSNHRAREMMRSVQAAIATGGVRAEANAAVAALDAEVVPGAPSGRSRAPARRRVALLAAWLVGTAVIAGGVAGGVNLFARRGGNAAPARAAATARTQAAPRQEVQEPAAGTNDAAVLRLRLPLLAPTAVPVLSSRAGVVLSLTAQVDSAVNEGQIVANLVDARAQRALRDAKQELERLRRDARSDPSLRLFVRSAEARYTTLEARAKLVPVTATARGRVSRLLTSEGQSVKDQAVLLEIEPQGTLVARLSAAEIGRIAHPTCIVTSLGDVSPPCRIELPSNGEPLAALVVDNRAELLRAGQVVELEIRPGR